MKWGSCCVGWMISKTPCPLWQQHLASCNALNPLYTSLYHNASMRHALISAHTASWGALGHATCKFMHSLYLKLSIRPLELKWIFIQELHQNDEQTRVLESNSLATQPDSSSHSSLDNYHNSSPAITRLISNPCVKNEMRFLLCWMDD